MEPGASTGVLRGPGCSSKLNKYSHECIYILMTGFRKFHQTQNVLVLQKQGTQFKIRFSCVIWSIWSRPRGTSWKLFPPLSKWIQALSFLWCWPRPHILKRMCQNFYGSERDSIPVLYHTVWNLIIQTLSAKDLGNIFFYVHRKRLETTGWLASV